MFAGQIVTSALMIWKILVLLTGSESPVSASRCLRSLAHCIASYCPRHGEPAWQQKKLCMPCLQVVVVLSGSMEPGFYRGDILFLNLGTAPIRVGEVVVFNIDGRDVPIVHRVVKVHERSPGGEIDILTKVGGLLVFLMCLASWHRCLKIVDHGRQHAGMLHLSKLCDM